MGQINTIDCLILADMHWGAIDPNEFERELDDGLFEYIDGLHLTGKWIDCIFIAGDLFDTKESLSSLVVQKVITFLGKLMQVTEDWETEIVLIEGTRTHDNLQLDVLYHIFDTLMFNNRIRVCKTVSEGELKGLPILLIPEEYVVDQDAYYSKYFQDTSHYYLIIGHGMVDKIWYAKKDKDSIDELTKHMSAPVFKVDTLLEHCDRCYFGHVHMNKSYGANGRFSYIGPYTNWEFGKSTKVGFYHVTINQQNGEVTDTYIENTNAKNYPTVIMKITENMFLNELNDMVDTNIANVYANVTNIGKVRLIVILPQTIETWQTMKDFLIGKCGNMPNVKFVLQLEENDSNDDTDTDEDKPSKSYLFDHSIDISRRIQTFIKNKSGRDISIETIEKYLNS